MNVSINQGPLCGCLCDRSPSILGLYVGTKIESYVRAKYSPTIHNIDCSSHGLLGGLLRCDERVVDALLPHEALMVPLLYNLAPAQDVDP